MDSDVKQSEQARLLATVSPAEPRQRANLRRADGVFLTEGGHHVLGERPDCRRRRVPVLQQSPDHPRGR